MPLRKDDLVQVSRLLSRRCFCSGGLVAVASALPAIGGCGGESRPLLTTGPLDDAGVNLAGDEGGTTAGQEITDEPVGDAGVVMTTCPGAGAIDAGPPSTFTLDGPTLVDAAQAFVIRDRSGLYAVSAVCTHQRCTLRAAGGGFVCPCHGAKFTLSGSVTVGPAVLGLSRLALCLLPGGNVGVIPTMKAPTSQRLGA